MELQQATLTDYQALLTFYDDVIERTPGIERYAQWRKGIHPTAEDILAPIREGIMYLHREQDSIAGAVVVTLNQGKDYHAIDWQQKVADDEVAVIHLVAVSPDKQGAGLGAQMVRSAIELARAKGMKAIRLETTASNTPAHRFYERLGFRYRGQQLINTGNNGWLDFFYFEYQEA